MTRPFAHLATEALAALPKEQRDEILSLPENEAMVIIKLLVAFPGSTYGS